MRATITGFAGNGDPHALQELETAVTDAVEEILTRFNNRCLVPTVSNHNYAGGNALLVEIDACGRRIHPEEYDDLVRFVLQPIETLLAENPALVKEARGSYGLFRALQLVVRLDEGEQFTPAERELRYVGATVGVG